MSEYVAKDGTVYEVNDKEAWPKTEGMEIALATGHFVDARLARDDRRVEAAGSTWMEVYEFLRANHR